MIGGIPEKELGWLRRFFSGQNHLQWKQILDQSAPANWLMQVVPWLKFLVGPSSYRPIVLPLFGPKTPLHWYGMADNNELMSQLIEEIHGFLGPSYSDFRGELCRLSNANETEAVLLERFGNRVIQFQAQSQDDILEIERMLLLYQNVLARRPPRPDRTRRPFGKIRGEFDRALLTGNAVNAKALLNELNDSGRVNAEQRKFLEIRFFAGLDKQEELARDHSLITSVMDLPLPPQTIADLVQALYEVYILPIETNSDPEVIKTSFKQHIANRFGPIFRERKGIRLPKVLRAFLLFELIQEEPNLFRCQAIIEGYPHEGEGEELIRRWFSSITQPSIKKPRDAFEQVRQAIVDEDYESAIKICYQALPSPWAYSALLRCAVEQNDPNVTRRVIDAIENADDAARSKFTKKDLTRLEKLRSQQEEGTILRFDYSWVTWASWVRTGPPYDKMPMVVLEGAILNWRVEDYIHDAEQCALLAQLIGNATGESENVFRTAFPHLVEFFVERPVLPVRTFVPLYNMFIKVIAMNGNVSADELELVTSLVQALMNLGPSKSAYMECIDDLCEILAGNSSPMHFDWALNTAEMLALYPTQDPELRLRFFVAVTHMMQVGFHRMTSTQSAVLEILVKDYNCPQVLELFPAIPSTTETMLDNRFSGLVGIYTLMETAGQRAKQLLQKLLPNARIELNCDSVGTERLKHLANNSDVFIFAWRSSKHQAYYCIKSARKEREILLPQGKGTASIVKSAIEALRP